MGGLAAQGGGGPHPIRHIKISDQPIDVKISDQPIDVKISDQPIDVKISDQPIDIKISTISGQVNTRPLSCDTDHPDICDRANRLVGITYGSRGAQLQQDVSNYLINIDIVHSKIHQGVSFNVGDLTLLVDILSPKKYLIITPNTSARAHMTFIVETQPGAKFEFFEDTTATDGVALSIINYKRDSSNVSVLQVFKDPTVTVDGTLIFLWQLGTTTAGGKVGGNFIHDDEFILKQNAKYQVKITPLSNNTAVFIHFDWYEIGV